MLFDTHAHMDDRAFDADRKALLESLQENQIGLLMNPGCSLASSRNASRLSEEYPWIYAAVGSHPDAADEVCDEVLEEYRKLCKLNSKIRAIGEIGLDYHYEDIPRQLQKKAFEAQLALAEELGLPVIVHDRDAHEDCMNLIRRFPEVKGVFCTSALMVLGAMEELDKAEAVVKLVGVDMQSDAMSGVEDGKILALVGQNGYEIGYQTIRTMVQYLQGKDIDHNVYVETPVITQENAAEYLEKYLTERGEGND